MMQNCFATEGLWFYRMTWHLWGCAGRSCWCLFSRNTNSTSPGATKIFSISSSTTTQVWISHTDTHTHELENVWVWAVIDWLPLESFVHLFSPFTETLLEFPCKWNYRPDHCIYGSNCASAEEDGIYILHGNRGVYHDHKQPAFRAVYEAIRTVGRRQHNCGSEP